MMLADQTAAAEHDHRTRWPQTGRLVRRARAAGRSLLARAGATPEVEHRSLGGWWQRGRASDPTLDRVLLPAVLGQLGASADARLPPARLSRAVDLRSWPRCLLGGTPLDRSRAWCGRHSDVASGVPAGAPDARDPGGRRTVVGQLSRRAGRVGDGSQAGGVWSPRRRRVPPGSFQRDCFARAHAV
jgi:hypothetical protein